MFEISIQKSTYCFYFLTFMHACGFVLPYVTQFVFIIVFSFLACLLSYYYCYTRYIALTNPAVIKQISRQISGDWFLKNNAGFIQKVTLKGDSLITSFLIILNFKAINNKTISVVLFPDSLDKQVFRRLCVMLRHEVIG